METKKLSCKNGKEKTELCSVFVYVDEREKEDKKRRRIFVPNFSVRINPYMQSRP